MVETLGIIQDWKTFVKAGNSIFTIENTATGNRFTYQVVRCKDEDEEIWFVSVLNGPNNETDYAYIGSIFGTEFRLTHKSRFGEEAVSVKAFRWLSAYLHSDQDLPEGVVVHHEGRCGRCGRRLTVPESIESGYGPECIHLVRGGVR